VPDLVGQRSTPWGVGWTKIAIGMPDWLIASAALSNARAQGVCR
jgi:phosphoenolpyruvate carboxylase